MIRLLSLSVVIAFFINYTLFAQGEAIKNFDSLLVANNHYTKEDALKLRMLNQIAYGYYTRDPSKGIKASENALLLAQKLKNEPLLADAYFSKGTNIMVSGKYDEAITLYEKALLIYTKVDDKDGIGFCYDYIAEVYRRQSNLPKVIEYGKKSLSFFEQTGNPTGQADIYNLFGCLNINEANYLKAIENFKKAIERSERIQDYENLAMNLNNLGLVYVNVSDYKPALDCFEKATEYNTKLGNKAWVAIHYDNMAWVYYKTKNYSKSIGYYQKALAINQSIGNQTYYAISCNHIGLVYKEAGNYQEAFSYFQKAQEEASKRSEKNTLATSLFNLGTIYLYAPDDVLLKNNISPKDKYPKALTLFKQSISLSNAKGLQNSCLKEISYIHEKTGNFKEALNDYKTFVIRRDSIDGEEVKKQITRKEIQFEFEKKESELKFKQQLALKKIDNEKIFLLTLLIFITLGAIIFYLTQRQKVLKQEKANSMNFTKQLLENTEDERKRIASDLHDSISHELLNLKSMFKHDFTKLNTKVDAIINDIRGISRNLHPVMFDKIGLTPNIEQLVERIQVQNNFLVSTEIAYSGKLISADELQIYRIIQESLSNIIKYAKAHAAKITILEEKDKLKIEIRDNGKGFNVKETLNSGKAFGLHNIIERSRVIGGVANIQSSAEGTIISIEIPMEKA